MLSVHAVYFGCMPAHQIHVHLSFCVTYL